MSEGEEQTPAASVDGLVDGSGSPTAGGANQTGVRVYNERLILSLVRRSRHISKVEVSRQTGLSVQTTSAIMNKLQLEGFLRREAPQRGRVGQPAIPFSLSPDGAYSLGLKIGRRSCDLVLIDFTGAVRARVHETFAYPRIDGVLAIVADALPVVTAELSARQRRRIVGLGIAAPFQLWNWSAEIGAPAGAMDGWSVVDIQREVGALSPYPVSLSNDATAACAAELFFGEGWRHSDFLYFFVGAFVGGGVVLGGTLFQGRTANAGAVGSMPIPLASGAGQLIASASIYQLERRLTEAGRDAAHVWRTPHDWGDCRDLEPFLGVWIEEASRALAQACVAAISVIDFEAIVIDGAMPAEVRDRLVARVAARVAELDRRGLSDVVIQSGAIGADARAIGGAALPLLAHFARDREVLFRDAPGSAA
jgi:predicted NBD/HSP70 family sugar kinase